MDSNLCIGDVSVVNPSAATYRREAARTAGSAASVRDAKKWEAYRAYDPDAYDFVPLSHESYGRLGKPAMAHLNKLAEVAARCGEVSHGAFVTNALRRLSVALCKGNACILRMGVQALVGSAGRAAMHACVQPVAHD